MDPDTLVVGVHSRLIGHRGSATRLSWSNALKLTELSGIPPLSTPNAAFGAE
jgi:hypothetical protein